MKSVFLKVTASLLVSVLTVSCTSQSRNAKAPKFFNEKEFVGLEAIGEDNKSIRIDYELDSSKGGVLKFRNCVEVGDVREGDVQEQQYQLLKLMQINCKSAELYSKAPTTAATYWDEKLDSKFVDALPAKAVPDLGGESMQNRNGTMGAVEPNLKIVGGGEHNIEVLLNGNLEINYVIMARGDLDGDGYDDLLLRLDWNITSAFGKGFDLVMLSKTAADQLPSISWRWRTGAVAGD